MVFRIIALIILAAFYACYYIKLLGQKKKGIKTTQIGSGKTGFVKWVECTMMVSTVLVVIWNDPEGKQGAWKMPKRVGFLYEWMCDKEHIRDAIMFGAKGKRRRYDVKEVLDDIDAHIDKVHDILVAQSFVPATPRKKQTYDTCGRKWRTIEYVKFFPDGIIHTLMVMAVEPTVLRGMSHWCCASVPGRGSKHAMKRVKRVIHHDRKGSKYVCKIDIRHYYHSVNRRKLIWALARKIKDKKYLKLVWDVLQTCEQGLAIGFFICQWLANFYLESLDRYITTLDGVKHSVRYMDDIVLFGPNKKKLHRARKAIEEYLNKVLGLEMKRNWQVFPLKSRPLDFVGYKFYREHITLA